MGNCIKIYKHHSHLNVRKHSFSRRVINDWNVLPSDIRPLCYVDIQLLIVKKNLKWMSTYIIVNHYHVHSVSPVHKLRLLSLLLYGRSLNWKTCLCTCSKRRKMVDQQEILPVNAFKTKIFAQKLASYIH